jgi:hypothetical protein
MRSVTITETRSPDGIEPANGGGAFPCLDIEFDESAGSLRIYDPRLFQAGRRGFCKRLLTLASRQPGITKAEVELASASCHIEFGPGPQTAQFMADSFVRAVQEASSGTSLLERMWWWRRRRGWSGMTSFRLPEGRSLWETFEVEPAQIRLRRSGAAGNRARPSRLADALSNLEGVESCRVSSWSDRITIGIWRDSPLSDRFMDTVEQALACLAAAELFWPERPALASPAAEASRKDALAKATWGRQFINIALAGGTHSITLMGLVVPGFRRTSSHRRPGIS